MYIPELTIIIGVYGCLLFMLLTFWMAGRNGQRLDRIHNLVVTQLQELARQKVMTAIADAKAEKILSDEPFHSKEIVHNETKPIEGGT